MKQKFFRVFADLKFSIFILLLISLCSIAGTIIEQDQSIETYKINYPLLNPIFGFLSWNFILFFGLDHVYKTWWFLILIFFFGFSLTLCSFLQQLPSLKIAQRCQFFRTTNSFSKLKSSTVLNNFSYNKILTGLKNQKYSIFQQKNIIYCYKGLIGRIAPIIVHFSMIFILIGTVFGSLFGFKAQEIIPKTESFHLQNILTTGPFTTLPITSGRVNDFWITYTKTKTISQFYSDISILDNKGHEVKRKTIYVNRPLVKNKVYYYQTDWNLIGLRLQESNQQIIQYPFINTFSNQTKTWLTWVSSKKFFNAGIIILADNLEGYISIYSNRGQFLGNLELNEFINLKESLTFLEIISSTGLQVKMDPGIPLIYLGFFSLMISTLTSYITYSQIWIIQKHQKLFVGGDTNRAMFDFELEFYKLVKLKM